MDLFILIFFVGLVAIISILLDRRWQRGALQRQPERVAQQSPPLPAANGQNTTLVEQIKAGWHKRMGWRSEPSADQPKLRDWLMINLVDHPTTQQWVVQLTDAGFSTLHQQLQTFCSALQIDLAWLGEQPLAKDPALQATVQAVVLHYVQAQQQASSVQSDLLAFKTYLALEQRPYSYEYQPLVQQLYMQLVKAGLTTPARPEALLATEKIRVEHMVRAIQQAADADRPAFYRVLNAVSTPLQRAEETKAPVAAPDHNQTVTVTVS
jgi:hypothetical protein